MWTKDSAETRNLDALRQQFQRFIPSRYAQKTTEPLPNRATHLGVLIEWAVANGMVLRLVEDDS